MASSVIHKIDWEQLFRAVRHAFNNLDFDAMEDTTHINEPRLSMMVLNHRDNDDAIDEFCDQMTNIFLDCVSYRDVEVSYDGKLHRITITQTIQPPEVETDISFDMLDIGAIKDKLPKSDEEFAGQLAESESK